MKKVAGIIVEYNPFHNGHKKHLLKAKEHGDVLVAVMSGDFVQRGEPAFINKWIRADMALKNGVDIVVELPVFYSTQSAEIFAIGSVGILNLMGVENLIFGSEIGNVENLIKISELEEKEDFKNELKKHLKEGYSYPTAYSNSLKFLGLENKLNSNDILGLEYIKAIKYWKSNIKPVAIIREKSTYYSDGENNGIASATWIRKQILEKNDIKNIVPDETYELLKNILVEKKIVELKDFYNLIRYKILTEKNRLNEIQDIEIGYENKLYESALKFENFKDFFENIKSKRYTIGRIQRILIHILLDIKKDETEKIKKEIPYIKILGFNKNGQEYLKQLKEKNRNIFTTLKNINKNLDEKKIKFLEKNEISSKIYSLVNKYEDRKVPIILKFGGKK